VPALLLQIAGAVLIAVLFLLVYPYLGWLAPWIAVAALLTFFVSLNLMILSTVNFLKHPVRRLWDWFLPLALALLFSIVELAFFGLLRFLIFGVNREIASPIEKFLRFLRGG
jgi:hypothetical protein